MSRLPAVADRFYPGEEKQLQRTLKEFLDGCNPPRIPNSLGVVSPHAGYVYSGSVCAETIKSVDVPETVIILGPNHHGTGAAIALSQQDWQMVYGKVPTNMALGQHIMTLFPEVTVDEAAHQFEHSLEVQIPFLQERQKNLSIVPLALAHLSFATCEKLGRALAQSITWHDKPVLLLASSDMSHYESRSSASRKDAMALERLTALDPVGLYNVVAENRISMCGIIPVVTVLLASLQLGANHAQVIRYTDSGEVSHDTDQVVGYAGAVISKR